jgi:hypothetical protein
MRIEGSIGEKRYSEFQSLVRDARSESRVMGLVMKSSSGRFCIIWEVSPSDPSPQQEMSARA